MKIESNFDTEMELYWEHAFNKFGFADGMYTQTASVAWVLEEEGFEVEYTQWGTHNFVIISIQKDGIEYMPDKDAMKDGVPVIGYVDPRSYLTDELVSLLDGAF